MEMLNIRVGTTCVHGYLCVCVCVFVTRRTFDSSHTLTLLISASQRILGNFQGKNLFTSE